MGPDDSDRLRLEQIDSRWRNDDSEAEKDVRWLIWQLRAAWEFLQMDHELIETLGERIRKQV